tara:strand:- start:308 stop:715 length:408 start_codon:yes stop_codon:yes gene_type:complete
MLSNDVFVASRFAAMVAADFVFAGTCIFVCTSTLADMISTDTHLTGTSADRAMACRNPVSFHVELMVSISALSVKLNSMMERCGSPVITAGGAAGGVAGRFTPSSSVSPVVVVEDGNVSVVTLHGGRKTLHWAGV